MSDESACPSCRGCKHYIGTVAFAVCKATDNPVHYEYNPYDGKRRQRYGFRPHITAMRASSGDCGPEARLFAPRWYLRLWKGLHRHA